jgi:hypothetical protein
MRIFLLLIILVGDLSLSRVCDGALSSSTSSIRRKRRVTTVADIEEYLNIHQRDTSSVAMIEPLRILEAKDWPRHDFSMATDPPIRPPPKCNGALSRSDSVLEILRSVTPEPTLQNAMTPQGMAYAWITSDDPLASTTLKNPCDHMTQILQRYALVVMFYATSGDSWTNKEGWLTAETECAWSGITCHAVQSTVSVLMLCKYAPYKSYFN